MPDVPPSPLDVVRKTATRVRARGIGEVLSVAGARVRQAIGSEDVLVFLVRDLAGAAAPRTPEGLVVRRATGDDAAAYARDIGTDSPKTFRRRLSAATGCWLLIEGGRILHASWTTTKGAWTRELGRFFRPPEGDVYTYESFTRADARGRGAYPLVLGHLCADAAAAGLRRAWVGAEHHNPASLRAITKAGFRPGFEITFGRRWGRLHIGEARGDRAGECAACLTRDLEATD